MRQKAKNHQKIEIIDFLKKDMGDVHHSTIHYLGVAKEIIKQNALTINTNRIHIKGGYVRQ